MPESPEQLDDATLRAHGWRVWGRPRGREALWRQGRGLLTGHAAALAAARAEEARLLALLFNELDTTTYLC